MKLTIQAFGIAREIVGGRSFEFETPQALTVAALKQKLLQRYPVFGDLASLLIAVNAEYGNDDTLLHESDEIVLIPPVSGG